MTALTMNGIGHAYFGRFVLKEVSLRLHAGEVAALVGPSGSGKSTLLAIAAGILEAQRGTVQRFYARHAMVFQEPRLMPWATAFENIAYPLRLAGIGRGACAARVAEVRHWRGSIARIWASIRWSSRAGCASVSRSPGRWRPRPTSSSSTSPSPPSTPGYAARCRTL
jgi:ABC-type phosphate transport system ATPase subunit